MDALPIYKVVIAGDANVGKSSLIRRYCEGRFETARITTIGVDFHTKVIRLSTAVVKLSIWDMSGQERFEIVRTGFYRGARAAALVYDLAAPESFTHLQHWTEEIRANSTCQRFVVVANKADIALDHNTLAAQEYAFGLGAAHLITSAATGQGVERMFTQLAELANTVT